MMTVLGQVVADFEGWQHMTGWGWGWMTVGMLFWLSVIALVVWSVGRMPGGSQRRPDADEMLLERFARGDLSIEEFEERRAALRR